MIVDYSTYLKKKALLSDPSKELSPDVRAKVEAALAEYDAKFGVENDASMPLRPDAGAAAINAAQGLPSQEDISQGLSHGARQTEDLTGMVDPGFATIPQALAVTPATTHPLGDDGAKDEWVRGDIDNPNGRVIVYDAPLWKVQEDLAKNPALLDAMGASISPGAQVQKGDSVEQAYQQFMWRQTADAAAKAGKTAYRYSKAPWLADGKNAGILDNLSLKLKGSALPAIEQGTAFVLGVDDMGNFGLGKAGAGDAVTDFGDDTGLPKRKGAVGTPIGGGKDEVVGGVTQTAQESKSKRRDYFNAVEQEYPKTKVAGQVVAAAPALVEAAGKGVAKGVGLASEAAGAKVAGAAEGIAQRAEWLPSNQLWSYVTGKPAETAAGKVVGGAVKNAIAGGTSEAIQAGTEAADRYRETGDSGMTLGQYGTRVAHGAEGAGVLGALGGGLHALAGGIASWTREGPYYKQIPGMLEQNGVEVRLGKGFMTPSAIEAARNEARSRPERPQPIQVIGEKTAKPLGDAVYENVAATNRQVNRANEEVFRSPEGKAPLPATQLGQQAVDDLRKNTSRRAGQRNPSSVAIPNAERPARAVLNMNVDGVSAHPVEGAIPVTPEEAETFLHPVLQEKAVEAAQTKKATRVSDADLATVATDFEDDLPMVHTPEEAHVEPGPERTPSERHLGAAKEETAVAAVDRYREPRAPQLGEAEQTALTRVERYRPPEAPQLGTSETRYSGEPDWRHSPWFEGYDPTPGGPMVQGSREARPGESVGPRPVSAREVGPRGDQRTGPNAPGIEAEGRTIPDAEFTERKARAGKAPPDAKFKRRGPQEQSPGSTAQELRKAGVKTVYLLPRKYDARRQEAVIQILRTGGGDSEKARRLEKFYQAAKRDRQQRSWKGKPGGYAELQAQHEQQIATAKDLRKRVAPKGSAKQATVRLGNANADSENMMAVQRAAQLAGGNNPDLVTAARILAPLDKIQALQAFGNRTSHGGDRLPWGPSALSDAAILRGVYPTARAIERSATGGAQTASRLGQAALHDGDERKKTAPKPKTAQRKRKRYPRR